MKHLQDEPRESTWKVGHGSFVAESHALNQISIQHQREAGACSLGYSGPRTCPFGGACHTCPAVVQAKLVVGEPADKYEKEADRIADEVMRMPDPRLQLACSTCEEEDEPVQMKPLADRITPLVQRQVDPKEEEEEETLQMKAETGLQRQEEEPEEEEELLQRKRASHQAPQLSAQTEALIRGLEGGGRPLSQMERDFFEPRFRCSFADVRIHSEPNAREAAGSIRARAFTVGQDVALGSGQRSTDSSDGRHLLAHELTHVLQQDGRARRVQRYDTEDCESDDVSRIDASHNKAIEMLERSIARLEEDPVTSDTQRHFSNHFGGYGSWRKSVVVGHFKRDLKLLRGPDVTYECESECESDEGVYTYWIFGDIHVCRPWLQSESLNERGESFIHELHHWDPVRGHLDLGYHRNNTDNNTTWVVAVNNADAYSELAQDLYEQP